MSTGTNSGLGLGAIVSGSAVKTARGKSAGAGDGYVLLVEFKTGKQQLGRGIFVFRSSSLEAFVQNSCIFPYWLGT